VAAGSGLFVLGYTAGASTASVQLVAPSTGALISPPTPLSASPAYHPQLAYAYSSRYGVTWVDGSLFGHFALLTCQ
jgi:hypothetical protein